MPGCGTGDPNGDEEYVNVVPAPQFLDKYVFFTAPTYGTTNLVLVRTKGPSGFVDVSVNCASRTRCARSSRVKDGWKASLTR